MMRDQHSLSISEIETLSNHDITIVSIVIPTRNRAALLSKCLDGVAKQQPSELDLEVIIVDNSDEDGLVEQIVKGRTDFQSITCAHVQPPGVSRARNKGIELAGDQITVFLDDDEIPCDGWLTELIRPFAVEGSPVDIVSGDYEPEWGGSRPSWLEDRYLQAYSGPVRWSAIPRLMKPGEWVLEGNVAIRTELLRQSDGFDERLGRNDRSLISGENALFEIMRKQGAVAYYTPHALVKHLIHSDRLSRTWLIKRMFAEGVTKGIQSESIETNVRVPADVAVSLSALLNKNFEEIEGEELLVATQVFHLLGYILQKKRLL